MKNWTSGILLGLSLQVVADEGMWQPHQLPALESVLTAKGLRIDPQQISKLTEFPMNAVVSLGGCTASFVSPKGLVITNHHCAYGSIQHNSTADNNLLEKGFLASTMAAELPAAPGSRVYVTEQVTNVTARVIGDITDAVTGAARYEAIEEKRKALIAECEQDSSYRCQVPSFHGGLEYYLVKALAIRDVRLVHAPANAVGKYGGDIDNWMWPRHTGDYAFYRAYVGADGKPADYSENNVPFVPPSHLKVSAKGVQENDFVMVAGYPGRTNRYRLAAEVDLAFNSIYPTAKHYRETVIDIINQQTSEGSDERVKYENKIASLANYAKNYGGMISSYQRSDFQQRKNQLERDLNAWIGADKARKSQYGETMRELNAVIAEDQKTWLRDLSLSYVGWSSMYSAAKRLYRLAHERKKPDLERKSGYQERNMKRFEQRLQRITNSYVPTVDKAVLLHFLQTYAQLEESQRVAALDKFFELRQFDGAKLKSKLDNMYADTKLGDEATRLQWMQASVQDFIDSDDPFIQLAVATYDADMAIEGSEDELTGKLQVLRPKYMQAIIEYYRSLDKPVYADANSTLRVTYGNVEGYSPKDGAYMVPFTSLRGLVQKETGQEPFNSPPLLLTNIAEKNYDEFYLQAIDSVPVNFLSTLDSTGGNSGSPTLNGNAELVGLLFDGVFESIIADWDFDRNLARSIHVDSRYMLWVMKHVDGATNLIEEMTIVR